MQKQALVIGLGQFGMAVARSLKQLGVEVICVDRRRNLVEAASRFADEAVAIDATDEAGLARLDPASRDLCICSIGDEGREGSILVTALLRQMGAKRIIARAGDELLARVLQAVGAHEVINPELSYGERLAPRLVFFGVVLDEVQLHESLVVTTIRAPQSIVGRSLVELELPRRFGVTVAAFRAAGSAGAFGQPDPRRPLAEGDLIVVVSSPDAVRAMMRRW